MICHRKLEGWHLIRRATSTPVSDADVLVTKPEKDPSSTEWKVFATGLHNPMGMELIGPGHIVVTQMAEFTEIIDTDQDGVADRFNNSLPVILVLVGITMKPMPYVQMVKVVFTSHWARHRTMAPLSLLLGANTPRRAGAAEIFHPMTYADGLSVITKTANSPFASGFRMHNGITRSPDGEIWCGDNQGDWRGGSPIYNVRPGSFNGHPSSLVWDPDLDGFQYSYLPPKKDAG